MGDIYATPEAELEQNINSYRAGGNIDDGISGNFEIDMLDTLGEAWRGLKGFKLKCMVAILLYLMVFIMLGIGFGVVVEVAMQTGADVSVAAVLQIVFQFVITAISMPMSIAFLIMGMRHANGKSVSSGEIFRHFGAAIWLLLAYILMTIMILLGLILLVIPGLYLAIAYVYAMPLIVEKKMGIWHAMETSRKAMTRVWFRFFGLMLLLGLINLVAMLPLLIGLIWTIPLTILTMAMVYQTIFGIEAHTLAD